MASHGTLRSRTVDTPEKVLVPGQNDADMTQFSVGQGDEQSSHCDSGQMPQTEENVVVNIGGEEGNECNQLDGSQPSISGIDVEVIG
jgi:hypothetical protein